MLRNVELNIHSKYILSVLCAFVYNEYNYV